jgi:hypothetical protein
MHLLASVVALPPVVLVPGLGGSVVKVKLHDAAEPHVWCAHSSHDWFVQWLSLTELLPLQKDCTLARLALAYNRTSGAFTNAAGVEIDSNVDFGGVGGVKYVDPAIPSVQPYFAALIDNLTSTLGYTVGQDLHGAGYDWRLGPLGHTQAAAPGGFFEKLRALIEGTVANNTAKAHIVTHSLGGPTTLAFLHAQVRSHTSNHTRSHTRSHTLQPHSLPHALSHLPTTPARHTHPPCGSPPHPLATPSPHHTLACARCSCGPSCALSFMCRAPSGVRHTWPRLCPSRRRGRARRAWHSLRCVDVT